MAVSSSKCAQVVNNGTKTHGLASAPHSASGMDCTVSPTLAQTEEFGMIALSLANAQVTRSGLMKPAFPLKLYAQMAKSGTLLCMPAHAQNSPIKVHQAACQSQSALVAKFTTHSIINVNAPSV